MVTHVRRVSRLRTTVAVLAGPALALTVLVQPATAQAGSAASGGSARATILALARAEKKRNDLNSVILSVKVGRRTILTRALGTSMTDVPVTTAMHFRIGSVAFA
jgi:D-alanyl-D-alanine carboxypeptidase